MHVLIVLLSVALFGLVPNSAYSSTSTTIPPFLQVSAKPNILVILDNSNSMDENFHGDAVGSYAPSSKTVVGKKALKDIIDAYKDKLRVGLMAYQLPGVNSYHIHDSPYFASYDPKSYCPDPPPECVQYCQTGDSAARSTCDTSCRAQNPLFAVDYFDEIVTDHAVGSEPRNRYCSMVYPKTEFIPNPTDATNNVYFKMALPYYNSGNDGTQFCYSGGYNSNDGQFSGTSPILSTWDSYQCYATKVGSSDGNSGYSTAGISGTFWSTDSDVALGYYDFGRRFMWTHIGPAWFANSSPGGGFLYVPVNELVVGGATTSTYTKLWQKLDPKENDSTGYMSCHSQSSTDSCHVINAGLTPTAGTFQSAIDYLKGASTPIQGTCTKTFIVYVTDGLPSTNESGTTDTAVNLMPTVQSKLEALRALRVGGRTFDIKTYVLGVGLSDPAKTQLDKMAKSGGTQRETGADGCTNPDGCAFYADNPTQLSDALTSIFSKLSQPVASAGAVATVSQEIRSGDIVIRGALRAYEEEDPDTYVWFGHVEGYWPYAGCNAYDGDQPQCAATTGCSWTALTSTCNGEIYSFQIPDHQGLFCPDMGINGYCWDGGQKLANTGSFGRKIFTWLSGHTPKKIDLNDTFVRSYLNNQLDLNGDSSVNSTDTDLLVNWVYGDNATNGRNRHGWILGDIVYSTPVVVGPPSLASVPRKVANEDCSGSCTDHRCFHCYNSDPSIEHRRQAVYIGANDGMLHAFEGGEWDTTLNKWILSADNATTLDNNLGKELWSYVPSNLLSELQQLANANYGKTSSSSYLHRYMVDLAPQTWEVKIPHDNSTTVKEWRTVLLGGERGGGDVYFALDVHDPDNATVLWEHSMLKNYPAPTTTITAGYTSHYDTLKRLPLAWSQPYMGRILAPGFTTHYPYVAFAGGGVRDFRPDVADANATLKVRDLDGWQYLYYPTFKAIDLETGADIWHDTWANLLNQASYRSYFPIAGNLIGNGGFETAGGGGADVWGSWTESAGNGSIVSETSIVHHNAKAAKLTAGTSANTYVMATATVLAGQQYQLDFWTRGDGSNAGRYQIRDVTNSADIVATTSTGVTGTGYTKVTKQFTAPSGCTSVQVYLRCPSANTKYAYFDDVWLAPYPYVVMPYAVSNVAAFDVFDAAGVAISRGGTADGFTDVLYAGDYNGTFYSLPINAAGENATTPSCVITRKTKSITGANSNPYRGSRQPITVTPVAAVDEASSGGNLRVFFGTGKFDDVTTGENSDKTDNATMSFYCLLQDLSSRSNLTSASTTIVTAGVSWPKVAENCRADSNAHYWVDSNATNPKPDGDTCFQCVLDFDRAGERVLDSALVAAGYVFFTTFIPNNDACSAGGTAYLYVLDYMCRPIINNPITSTGTMSVGYRDRSNGAWSTTAPASKQLGAVRVDLGTGMPSRPVLDSKGENILVQTSDARLIRIGVNLGVTGKSKIDGWTRETAQ